MTDDKDIEKQNVHAFAAVAIKTSLAAEN